MEITSREGRMFIEGCGAEDLARAYGTPLYVYSEPDIVDKCRGIRREFLDKYEDTRAAYAAKAFCTMGMVKLVEREGLCLDVVSGGELDTALQAGFPPERIEFNGNNKLPAELEMAVEAGIGRIIVDGLQELSLLEGICAARGRKMKVLFRVTPAVDSHTHAYISTGKKDSKFGIPMDPEILWPLVERALSSQWVDFLGFHFHVGSQLHENGSHLAALETVLDLSGEMWRRWKRPVRELNIGGGFSARYLPGEPRQPWSYFLDPVMERVEARFSALGLPRPAVVIEPGRSIVAEAGLTLYTVGSVKDIPGVRKYVSVDGGMTDNIRPALYQAAYTVAAATRMDEAARETVTVCGKCCESGDILARDVSLPPVEAGDLLAVYTTGAYGYSMASNYNSNPIPAAVLVKEGRAEVLVRRQSYADMTALQEIPPSLR